MRVFTDGSVISPRDPRFRRGAFTIFLGIWHPSNVAFELNDLVCTSFRAELSAVLVVVENSKGRVWITLDNKSVADIADVIFRDYPIPRKVDANVETYSKGGG